MREQTIRFRGQEEERPDRNEPAAEPAITGDTLEERVVSALRSVYDPELPVNVYDLGLIYDIDLGRPGKAGIAMTLTSPACPVAGTLPGMVQKAVLRLEEIDEVTVSLVWDPPWTQDRMSDEARLEMGLF